MYSECIKCPKIGISCDGPNFFAMSTPELLAWCKARKAELRVSNAQLAEKSGMPKGTIDRLFAGEHVDFRYETIRPLLKALTGGAWEGNPCATIEEDEALRAELQRMEEKVRALEVENTRLRYEAEKDADEHSEELKFLRSEIKRKNKFTTAMTILFVLAALYIIVLTIIDRLDPTRGYWWLESMLHIPQSIIEHMEVNT